MAHHIIREVDFDIDALLLEGVAISSDDEHREEHAVETTFSLTAHEFCPDHEGHESNPACGTSHRESALVGILQSISAAELSPTVEERFRAALFIATRTHEPTFTRLPGRPFWNYEEPGRELDDKQKAEFAAAFEQTYRSWEND